MDPRIEVLQSVVVTLEEYLRTRLVELVVHLDDLAVSVGEETGQELPQVAFDEVAAVLVRVAVREQGRLAVVRHPAAIRVL